MANTGIIGIEKVSANLNKQLVKIKGQSLAGLIKAAAYLRVDMEKTPPIVPADTGNLRQSWTVIPNKTAEGFGVIFGFTANYAFWVHENVGAHFKRPGSGAKFLEKALERNHDEILRIVQQNVKL